MDKKIEMAIDDITLIRRVIERTRQDFSRISAYFIGIGIEVESVRIWTSSSQNILVERTGTDSGGLCVFVRLLLSEGKKDRQ